MASKKIKVFANLDGWDALDTFYGEKIEGVQCVFEDKFTRRFCRCGNTLTEYEPCECGNSNFKNIPDYSHFRYESSNVYLMDSNRYNKYDSSSDNYRISERRLKLDVNDRISLTFSYEDKAICDLTHKKSVVHDEDALKRCLREDMANYPYMKEYASLRNIFGRGGYDTKEVYSDDEILDVKDVIRLMKYVKAYPTIAEDIDAYRYMYLSRQYFKSVEAKGSKKGFLKTIEEEGVYPEHFETLNIAARDKYDNYYSHNFRYQGKNVVFFNSDGNPKFITYSQVLKELETKYSSDKNHMFSTFYHSLVSGAIDFDSFFTLLSQYNYLYTYSKNPNKEKEYGDVGIFEWRDVLKDYNAFSDFWEQDYITLFPTYYKENLYGKNISRMVAQFCLDLNLMKEYKIPINKESIKLKNFNLYLNERKMAEDLKMPADKIEVFLDTFDIDPIAACSLLKDRRKLTKKQAEEYMALINKEANK